MVDVSCMPNDVHEIYESGVVELHFGCRYGCKMWILKITKVLNVMQIVYLACASFSVCILCVALCPYVSMGIVD